jgi:hypothetical protein|nr:DUF6328 family protein [Caldimonas sp.]
MATPAVVRRDDPAPGDSAESLKDALSHTLDEARMVLPGVQALFGFQLIAVFSDGFANRLSDLERDLHLVAIVLVTVAIALLMTPAAYHRQVDPRRTTGEFLALASRLISVAMLPLAAGLALDIHLVARVVAGSATLATALGAVVFAMFVLLWYVFPQWRAARKHGPGR